MNQTITSGEQKIVVAGEWDSNGSALPYRGKYTVGRFTMSNDFMFQYMCTVQCLPISINNNYEKDSHFSTTENAISYLEHYGMIDNHMLLQMKSMIKHPKNGFIVLHKENVITGIFKDETCGKS